MYIYLFMHIYAYFHTCTDAYSERFMTESRIFRSFPGFSDLHVIIWLLTKIKIDAHEKNPPIFGDL